MGAVQSANWKMQRAKWVWGWVAVPLLALIVASGCETAFEPFEESERAFSLFGYVDAGADVQFVRVSPLRDSLYARAEPLDATVTLEHVGTGETSVWRDSLFFFEGAAAHNFWSDAPVELGATYRMAVERSSDGAVSAATFRMPDREPDVGAAFDMFSPAVSVEIRKTDVLVRAELVYTVELSSGVLAQRTLSYLDEAIRFTDSEGDAGYAFEFNQTTARSAWRNCSARRPSACSPSTSPSPPLDRTGPTSPPSSARRWPCRTPSGTSRGASALWAGS